MEVNDMIAREIIPGFSAKFVHGEKTTLAFWEITSGSVMPEHFHVHEQVTYIMEGEIDMMIGGKKYTFQAGSVHVIPSNTPHSAVAVTNCKVLDAFSPARDDYR